MKNIWKVSAAVVVVAALFGFVAVQSAQAISYNYVAGFNCSPLSGSGANNTTTCKAFGDVAKASPKFAGVCSITLTFTSDPWTITDRPMKFSFGDFKYFNVSGTQLSYKYNTSCGSGKGGDERANHGHGDHVAAMFLDQDEHGKPDIKLYCITPEGGYYGGEINQAMLDGAPKSTEPQTLVKKFDACRFPVSLYVLSTGEFQLSFGPDAEGHIAQMAFTGLPPTNVHYYDVNAWVTPK